MQKRERFKTKLILLANGVLLLAAIVVFVLYGANYRNALFDQNLHDIQNLNTSSANVASTFLSNIQQQLKGITQYADKNDLSYEEMLDFLIDFDANENSCYQLIDSNFKGQAAIINVDAQYVSLDYSSGSYDSFQQKINEVIATGGEAQFVTEFSDKATGLNSFAICSRIETVDENGTHVPYALLAVLTTKAVNTIIDISQGYEGMSTVVIDKDGNYLLGNADFKSDNFFQYLYVFNNLTLEQKEAIRTEVQTNSTGTLSYKNSQTDCVFAYTPVIDTDWLCVSCVPTSSFHTEQNDIISFILLATFLICVLVIDVLWLRGVNRNLRKAAEREREFINAKSDFLSRMSHDLRTPLNGIIGVAGIALGEPDSNEKTRHHFLNIERSGQFMLNLVNDILDMSKVEHKKMTLHFAPCKFETILESLTTMFVPLCQNKGLEFLLEVDEELMAPNYAIVTDKMRLLQMLVNLLSNSVKFTSQGSVTLEIHVHNEISKDAHSPQKDSLDPDKAGADANVATFVFCVRDTGCGMNASYMKHLYEPFSQDTVMQESNASSAAFAGTGLGLPITKGIVDLFGASIKVQSVVNEGTSFTITMQAEYVIDRSSLQPAQPARSKEAIKHVLSDRRVLVCEDHPLNTEIILYILHANGLLTEHAENGKEAVDMFEQSRVGYYDIVLMDVQMPIMSGLDATRGIRALTRPDAATVPILALTANAFEEDIDCCLDAGMNAHLSKPIDPAAMIQTIADFLADF